MVGQETLPHAQAVRKVYENDSLASVPAVSDIFHVACYPDVSSGKDIILWDDILAAFKNVVHVRFGTMILPFLNGPDFKNQLFRTAFLFHTHANPTHSWISG
ncbi:hypothetical protein BKA57DRAFT_487989 [Linnemannia elongata]|nr:hypothetical protein BKA57DRAFT_487989 [Linnemannia elongata]